MIQANELRIGNLIKYNGSQITVEGILGRTIYHSGGKFDQNAGDNYIVFQPIPLTEEWLLRFNFFEVKGQGVLDIEIEGNRYLSINIDRKKCFVGCSVDWTNIKFPESVHQLQNLYFALTGKELEIK